MGIKPQIDRLARKGSRREFLKRGFWTMAAAGATDMWLLEPGWVDIRRVRARDKPICRLVHISDIHHRGDAAFLRRVVGQVNGIRADFVCFTGDLVDQNQYVEEALEILSGVNKPVFGVPGNHDFWCYAPLNDYDACFRATGGRLLRDQHVTVREDIQVMGLTGPDPQPAIRRRRAETRRRAATQPPLDEPVPSRRILLSHFPATADRCGDQRFDLILAGHSHGGQVRLPLLGAPVLPYDCGRYDRGKYDTPAGVLYVNPGLGTLQLRARLLCRPEITVIDV